MNKKFVLISFLSIVMVAAAFTPPLPEGAYPEWSYEKAWKTDSGLRETVCLNGLWQFRSDPRYKDEVIVATTHGLKMNGPGDLDRFAVSQPPNATVIASYDPSKHTEGNGSLKLADETEHPHRRPQSNQDGNHPDRSAGRP